MTFIIERRGLCKNSDLFTEAVRFRSSPGFLGFILVPIFQLFASLCSGLCRWSTLTFPFFQ